MNSVWRTSSELTAVDLAPQFRVGRWLNPGCGRLDDEHRQLELEATHAAEPAGSLGRRAAADQFALPEANRTEDVTPPCPSEAGRQPQQHPDWRGQVLSSGRPDEHHGIANATQGPVLPWEMTAAALLAGWHGWPSRLGPRRFRIPDQPCASGDKTEHGRIDRPARIERYSS